MSIADWIVLGIVAAAFIAAVIYAVKHKGGGCGGSCGSCPYSSSCHKSEGSKNSDENNKTDK